jgi:hypothetical protein
MSMDELSWSGQSDGLVDYPFAPYCVEIAAGDDADTRLLVHYIMLVNNAGIHHMHNCDYAGNACFKEHGAAIASSKNTETILKET